jgi:hypothetical protein
MIKILFQSGTRLPDPQHFPFLSRRLAAMEEHNQRGDQDSTSRSSTPTLDDEQAQSSHSYIYSDQHHSMNGGTHQMGSLPLNENLKTLVSDYNTGSVSADSSIEDVNAATAMLALKHGPKIFSETFTSNSSHPPVITSSPSEDHTYSAGISVGGGGAGSSSAVNGVVINRSTTNTSDNSSNETPVSDVAAYESSDERWV